jgi:hypothetical protein
MQNGRRGRDPHNVVSSAPRHSKSEIRTRNVIGDRLPYDHDHDDHFA